MNATLEDKLIKRFSFYEPGSIQESLMAFGFECEDGWFSLLWELSEKIEQELELEPIDKQAKSLLDSDFRFRVVQVKSKFGGLRYYVNQASDKIYNLIEEYSDRSEETCEHCGKPGIMRTDRWAICLCDDCLNKKD